MNDPTGQNDLSIQIVKSPVYSNSLDPRYITGENILKQIYSKLGFSAQEIEKLHYNADLDEFLHEIDSKCKEKKVSLSEPAALLLLHMDKPSGKGGIGDVDFNNLNELNSKL